MGINEQMCLDLIHHQQEGMGPEDTAYWVGMQLLDMVAGDEHAAGILAADLANNKDMSIAHAEAKIRAYADKHRKGNKACVPPQKAEEILREFYGLGEKAVLQSTAKPQKEELDLEDFL
jgi:hypothetical protein